MKKPPQSSRVVALRGKFQPELVTQDQLVELEGAQRTEWLSSKRAALLSERVKAAIERGAKVEDGPLYYDSDLEMVRTKKSRAG